MCDPITAVVAAATIGYSTSKINKMQNKAAQQQAAAIQQAQESIAIEQAPSFSDMQATALPTIAPPRKAKSKAAYAGAQGQGQGIESFSSNLGPSIRAMLGLAVPTASSGLLIPGSRR